MRKFRTVYEFSVAKQNLPFFGLKVPVQKIWIEICYTTSLENGERKFSYLGAVVKLVKFENGVRVKPKWPHLYLPRQFSVEELTSIMKECWQMEMEVEAELLRLDR